MEIEEQAIIVNDKDEVIGHKNRKDISEVDIVRVVVVWLENNEGQVLIHKRSATKKHGANRWENAAGGGVVRGQSYEEAAYAELSEEIGVDDIKLEYVTTTLVHTDKGDRMCAWFTGICNRIIEEFVLETENVTEVKWVEKEWLFSDRDQNPEKYMPSSIYWRELFSD